MPSMKKYLEGKSQDVVDNQEKGGGPIPDDLYEVTVEECVMPEGDHDSMRVRFKIVKGVMTGVDNAKRTFMEFFKDPESDRCNNVPYAAERMIIFALATKIATAEEIDADKDIDFDESIERTLIVKTKASPSKDGRVFTNVSFKAIYAIDDKRLPDMIAKLKAGEKKKSNHSSL